MNFVQPDSLSKLLCSTCKKYLSCFPIYTQPSGSTCGRCQPPEGAIHNEAFESLAEKQRFPCCHHANGCLENLFPKNVSEHENFCSYRQVKCPIIASPGCAWKGFVKDALQHFEDKHATFLLSEANFEIDFVNSHNENYLLPYGESLYIVNRANDSKSGSFSCAVSYMGTDAAVQEYSYKMKLKSGNGSQSHEICNKLGTVTEIDRNIISSILDDPVSIVARIEVFKEEVGEEAEVEEVDNTIQWDFLRELECLVCMEYMVPPIFQCITGHSICKACKDKVKECPTCKNEIGNTQNFALAQLVSFIDYPCKHDRCRFKAKPAEIKKHEACCTFGTVACPLNEHAGCDAQMTHAQIYEHVVDEHYERLLETDTVCEPFDRDELVEECYILRYDDRLFRLLFNFNLESLSWMMQLVGPEEESGRYCYDIDICDSSGRGNRAYCKASCSALSDEDDTIEVQYNNVGNLLTTELRYRVHIYKYNE